MPKIFSENERIKIIEDLRKSARECLALYGVKKTTVDELTERSNIAKGTFYLFYSSKEELFLDVINEFESRAEQLYLDMLQELDENHIVSSLTSVFSSLAFLCYDEGVYRFMDQGNMVLVKRKVKDASFEEVEKRTIDLFKDLFSYFSITDESDIASFMEAYKAILLLFLSEDKIENLRDTITFLIRGLVLQMVE